MWFLSWFRFKSSGATSSVEPEARAAEPAFEPVRVSKKSAALPGFMSTAKPVKDVLPETDNRTANQDLTLLRNLASTKDVINKFSKASPDLSAAVAAGNRLALPQQYTAVARNLDGTLNSEGTRLVQIILRAMDGMGAGKGYNSRRTLREVGEALGRELQIYGACSAELVLNAARLPDRVEPISVTTLKWKQRSDRTLYPVQKVGQEEISLDIPTFFYTSLDQDLTSAYPDSPVQSGIQPILSSQEFMNDLRRVYKRAVQPRTAVKINEEKWRRLVPPDVLRDPEKLQAFMRQTIADLEDKINSLAPEDALVLFDILEYMVVSKKDYDLSDEYQTMMAILNSKIAAGVKSVPVVLGHEAAASTNIASTQSMLFIKMVEGAIQLKLNELFSRVLTLAVRLYGVDAVVEFKYRNIDLRPEAELEAYRQMRQSRVLEQLSLGMITDEEASVELTGTLPPPGAPKWSGTGFKMQSPNIPGNPNSQTSVMNQTTDPGTPKKVRGKS